MLCVHHGCRTFLHEFQMSLPALVSVVFGMIHQNRGFHACATLTASCSDERWASPWTGLVTAKSDVTTFCVTMHSIALYIWVQLEFCDYGHTETGSLSKVGRYIQYSPSTRQNMAFTLLQLIFSRAMFFWSQIYVLPWHHASCLLTTKPWFCFDHFLDIFSWGQSLRLPWRSHSPWNKTGINLVVVHCK